MRAKVWAGIWIVVLGGVAAWSVYKLPAPGSGPAPAPSVDKVEPRPEPVPMPRPGVHKAPEVKRGGSGMVVEF